jgi:5,10-methylene-tetrahydrofolate dehydrogenase/methenyl tetrahydrofolate cyclohydrolase
MQVPERERDLAVAWLAGDWVRPGAVVIDAGYNEGNIGDVDFDER